MTVLSSKVVVIPIFRKPFHFKYLKKKKKELRKSMLLFQVTLDIRKISSENKTKKFKKKKLHVLGSHVTVYKIHQRKVVMRDQCENAIFS